MRPHLNRYGENKNIIKRETIIGAMQKRKVKLLWNLALPGLLGKVCLATMGSKLA